MILTRLYELAARGQLLKDTAFESLPVPFVIELGEGGEYLSVSERRGTVPARTKGGESSTKPDAGQPLAVPRAHGNTASQGFARYFADTVERVVPMSYDLDKLTEPQR